MRGSAHWSAYCGSLGAPAAARLPSASTRATRASLARMSCCPGGRVTEYMRSGAMCEATFASDAASSSRASASDTPLTNVTMYASLAAVAELLPDVVSVEVDALSAEPSVLSELVELDVSEPSGPTSASAPAESTPVSKSVSSASPNLLLFHRPTRAHVVRLPNAATFISSPFRSHQGPSQDSPAARAPPRAAVFASVLRV